MNPNNVIHLDIYRKEQEARRTHDNLIDAIQTLISRLRAPESALSN